MIRTNSERSGWTQKLAVALISLLICEGLPAPQLFAQAGNLRIVVLEGDGVRSDTAQRTLQRLAVQVQDAVTGAVASAEVTFTAPANGPGGVFSNGTRRITAMTDAQGLAVVDGFRPNGLPGNFEIAVEASYREQRATAIISQSNVGTAAKKGSSKWFAILGVAAGGAAIAAFAGRKGESGPTSNPVTPPVVNIRLTPGTPTAGPPG